MTGRELVAQCLLLGNAFYFAMAAPPSDLVVSYAAVDHQGWQLRINNLPDEPLYRLIIDKIEIIHLEALCVESRCTTGSERRMSRWEHEAVGEKVQSRLDRNPAAMTARRQTAEHPFGTIKRWMGATHFLMRRFGKVSTEMAFNVPAYNIKRVIAIVGVGARVMII
jgi:hypothetical protein